MSLRSIKTALISVYNKEGVVELCRGLAERGVKILASEGTAQLLKEAGLEVKPLSELTGFSELLGGRVKTLHPTIFAGILARRGVEEDERQLAERGIEPIDLVVVNLYPFGTGAEDPVELIDIGGPSLVRAAAKNFRDVAVLVDPSDYRTILNEIREKGGVSLETRRTLAVKAFHLTSRYDRRIADFFSPKEPFPSELSLELKRALELRYGENPHQRATLYLDMEAKPSGIAAARLHQGKALSYNNILDLDAALATVAEFEETTAVIIKHLNPCGVATSNLSVADAYRKARRCDPDAAFGGIIAVNREVDRICAEEIISTFMEAVIAPGYHPAALDVFRAKKNLRVMELPREDFVPKGLLLRGVGTGFLLQERDLITLDESRLKVVTKRAPTQEEMDALKFAWKVCTHAKSNAIVYAYKDRVAGIGVGQMSRVDSAILGFRKAKEGTQGTVVASDAFFPFRDSIDVIARAGATAIIQPGGSIRDEEVIAAADEYNLAMVFTGIRHFKH